MEILGKEYAYKKDLAMFEEQEALSRLNALEVDVRDFQRPGDHTKKPWDDLAKEWEEICALAFENPESLPKLAALNMGAVRRVGVDFFMRDMRTNASQQSEKRSQD